MPSYSSYYPERLSDYGESSSSSSYRRDSDRRRDRSPESRSHRSGRKEAYDAAGWDYDDDRSSSSRHGYRNGSYSDSKPYRYDDDSRSYSSSHQREDGRGRRQDAYDYDRQKRGSSPLIPPRRSPDRDRHRVRDRDREYRDHDDRYRDRARDWDRESESRSSNHSRSERRREDHSTRNGAPRSRSRDRRPQEERRPPKAVTKEVKEGEEGELVEIRGSPKKEQEREQGQQPVVLNRKPIPAPLPPSIPPARNKGQPAANGPSDEEDKLEGMMRASRRKEGVNGVERSTESTSSKLPTDRSSSSLWRKVNGEVSSTSHSQPNGTSRSKDVAEDRSRQRQDLSSPRLSRSSDRPAGPESLSKTNGISRNGDQKDDKLAHQTASKPLSFGHVLLPNELPIEDRSRNCLAVSSYKEGASTVLKTAQDKGVVDAVVKDPRHGVKKPGRLYRTSFHPAQFVWDSNSKGPKPLPPPRTVVLTGLSALTQPLPLLQHFRAFGRVESHKLEMNPKIGQSLGVFSVTFAHDFDEQGKVLSNVASDVIPQHGVKVAKAAQQSSDGAMFNLVRVKALLDRNGEVIAQQVKAAMAAFEAKLRPPPTPTSASKSPAAAAAAAAAKDGKSASPAAGSSTPGTPAKSSMPPPNVPKGPRASFPATNRSYPSTQAALRRAPGEYGSPNASRSSHSRSESASKHGWDDDRSHSRSYHRDDRLSSSRFEDDNRRSLHSTRSEGRHRSTDASRHPQSSRSRDLKEETRSIMSRLLELGYPYVFVPQPKSSDIVTDDIRRSLSQVQPRWIRQGDAGWYVAFDDRNGANGCKIVNETLTIRSYRLAVEVRTPSEADLRRSDASKASATSSLSAHPASATTAQRKRYDTGLRPISSEEKQKSEWSESELQDAVFRMIQKELADSFIRDIKSRLVNPHITQYLKPSSEGGQLLAKATIKKPAVAPNGIARTTAADQAEARLPSFRKVVSAARKSQLSDLPGIPKMSKAQEKSKGTAVESQRKSKTNSADSEIRTERLGAQKRAAVKAKAADKSQRKSRLLEYSDDESVDDEKGEDATSLEPASRSVSTSVEPPSTDGIFLSDSDEPSTKKKKKAAAPKKAVKKSKIEVTEDVSVEADPLEPQQKKTKAVKAPAKVKPIPADPFEAGLVEDEEDLYYLKLTLSRLREEEPITEDAWPEDEDPFEELSLQVPAKHETGSARTEGCYKIPAAQKAAHLPDRNKATEEEESGGGATNVLHSARNNRADSRRLVLGFEQHKRDTATDTDIFKFNQLRTRKKQLKFAKSPIHDWGLYAMELIPAGDMVIEYVGEVVRQQVADEREKQYERQGNFSTYLFRVDDDLVVDATHKGNIARLMNHCCTPNCTAKILTLNGEKRIVLFAKNPIKAGEELTYDYKFQSSADDEDAIPCLCGSPGCRRFL